MNINPGLLNDSLRMVVSVSLDLTNEKGFPMLILEPHPPTCTCRAGPAANQRLLKGQKETEAFVPKVNPPFFPTMVLWRSDLSSLCVRPISEKRRSRQETLKGV